MSFRQYGGITYAAKNNIVRNNYTNANNLSTMTQIGQPNSLIITDSNIKLNADLIIRGNSSGIYFPDGTFQNTAATGGTSYWIASSTNVNDIVNTNTGNVQITSLAVTTNATAPTPVTGSNDTQIATTAFVNAAVGGSVKTTIYTTSQTITLASSVKKADFILIGGGGGGQSYSSSAYGGAGGGACFSTYVNNGVSTSVTLTVGAGGAGVAGDEGLAGKSTVVTIGSFTATAYGGQGGTFGGALGGSGTGNFTSIISGNNSTSINGVGNNIIQNYGKGGNGVNNIGLSGSPGSAGVIIVTSYS